MQAEPEPVTDVTGARVLAVLGDSVTTDHISPAGSIRPSSQAGLWLQSQGVAVAQFNSYGARRGNHEVMIRGTFANPRIRNRLVPGTEGGVTVHLPGGDQMTIFEAAVRYRSEGVPLVVVAGKEYGSGSSRDWAAKGPALLGVRAVIAESFERIHRSNLIGMGVLPLQFAPGENAESLGLTGHESIECDGPLRCVDRRAGRARAHRHGRRPRLQGGAARRHAGRGLIPVAWRHPALCREDAREGVTRCFSRRLSAGRDRSTRMSVSSSLVT